jgi:Fanconi anemia group D2 protein
VLDALSNLHLDDALLATVQHKVMPKLQSAELQVLPLLVKFLLQTAGSGAESTSVLRSIRGLDVTALRVGSDDGSDRETKREREREGASAESLVIDSLRGGFRCNFAITTVVLKELEKTQAEHTPMDVWMLLVLHSLPGHRPKVQAISRKQAKRGALTAATVRRAVAASHSALREYFSDALALAGTLTRDSNPMPRRVGSAFYHTLFVTFEEDFHRQEVLQGLITHTGSASAREVDCALEVARELSANEPIAAELRRHLQFVQNIMDYMEAFADEQIRTLYSIFANLSLSCDAQQVVAWYIYISQNNIWMRIKAQRKSIRILHVTVCVHDCQTTVSKNVLEDQLEPIRAPQAKPAMPASPALRDPQEWAREFPSTKGQPSHSRTRR